MTKADDKLVAILGQASLYYKRTNDNYFAGIWQYNLLDYLLWISAPFATGNDRMETLLELILLRYSTDARTDALVRTYVAPSWSWASYHKGVYFSLIGADSFLFATFLEAQVNNIDGGVFSRVTGGFIYIQGPFFSISEDESIGSENLLVSENANIPSLRPTIL